MPMCIGNKKLIFELTGSHITIDLPFSFWSCINLFFLLLCSCTISCIFNSIYSFAPSVAFCRIVLFNVFFSSFCSLFNFVIHTSMLNEIITINFERTLYLIHHGDFECNVRVRSTARDPKWSTRMRSEISQSRRKCRLSHRREQPERMNERKVPSEFYVQFDVDGVNFGGVNEFHCHFMCVVRALAINDRRFIVAWTERHYQSLFTSPVLVTVSCIYTNTYQ